MLPPLGLKERAVLHWDLGRAAVTAEGWPGRECGCRQHQHQALQGGSMWATGINTPTPFSMLHLLFCWGLLLVQPSWQVVVWTPRWHNPYRSASGARAEPSRAENVCTEARDKLAHRFPKGVSLPLYPLPAQYLILEGLWILSPGHGCSFHIPALNLTLEISAGVVSPTGISFFWESTSVFCSHYLFIGLANSERQPRFPGGEWLFYSWCLEWHLPHGRAT